MRDLYIFCIVLGLGEINPEATGSGIFVFPVLAWPLIVIAMILMARLSTLQNRIIYTLSLLSHYVIIFLSVHGTFADYKSLRRLHHSWYVNGDWIAFTIVFYCLGQLAMWVIFFRSFVNQPDR